MVCRAAVLVGVVLGGCTAATGEQADGLLLFDAAAVRAGQSDTPLPERADGLDGVLTWAMGEDGDPVDLVIGLEVDPDRLLIDADPDIAAALADQLEAQGFPVDDLWELRGDDVLYRAADADPIGVREVFPVVPDEGGLPDLDALSRRQGCEQAVRGPWIGYDFRLDSNHWYRFILEVRCDDAHHLHGMIVSERYDTDPAEGDIPMVVVTMEARGALLGSRMSFAATRELGQRDGAGDPIDVPYNLDRLGGRVDADGFEARLNDGGAGYDRPIRFRRD